MVKLRQKEWLTIPDAVRYLTDIVQGPAITEADIIQYALDKELTICVRINVWTENCFPYGELHLEESSVDEFYLKPETVLQTRHFSYKNQRYFTVYDDETNLIPGIYDIANDPDSIEIISELWVGLTEGVMDKAGQAFSNPPSLMNGAGQAVRFCKYLNLIDVKHNLSVRIPDYRIPQNSYFVVRKSEIDALLEPTAKAPEKTTLTTKEKKTYLKVIRALCNEHKDIDLNQHSTAATQLIAMADTLGLSIPSKRTLEALLKEARDLEG
ncbi:MAG: hypothetical protein ACX933_06215 [Marinobacter adhaerens]